MSELHFQHLFQRFSSEVLWHFVGLQDKDDPDKCFKTLLSILQEGNLKLGSRPEPFIYHHQDGTSEELCGYPVNCLADIPLKDLPLHSMRYGEFAIGFHRKSAIQKHFMPVLYVPQKSGLIDYYLRLRGELESSVGNISEELAEKFEQYLLMLGSVAKPCNFDGNLDDDPARDELHMSNFYYEREWRSIYEWKFTHQDVAMIIVKEPAMVEAFTEVLNRGDLTAKKSVPILTFDTIFKI